MKKHEIQCAVIRHGDTTRSRGRSEGAPFKRSTVFSQDDQNNFTKQALEIADQYNWQRNADFSDHTIQRFAKRADISEEKVREIIGEPHFLDITNAYTQSLVTYNQLQEAGFTPDVVICSKDEPSFSSREPKKVEQAKQRLSRNVMTLMFLEQENMLPDDTPVLLSTIEGDGWYKRLAEESYERPLLVTTHREIERDMLPIIAQGYKEHPLLSNAQGAFSDVDTGTLFSSMKGNGNIFDITLIDHDKVSILPVVTSAQNINTYLAETNPESSWVIHLRSPTVTDAAGARYVNIKDTASSWIEKTTQPDNISCIPQR